jgi:UDP-N-acetylglucosamine transferase subunit ALG13
MILVTVGLHNQGFDRLIRAADELAEQIDEKLYIQYGSSNYIPLHAECSQWATSLQMKQLIGNGRIVITHAASGTVILALSLAKPLIVVPRARRFREHIDDHQAELAAALSESNQAVCVAYPTAVTLKQAIDQCADLQPVCPSRRSLIQSLEHLLNQWD